MAQITYEFEGTPLFRDKDGFSYLDVEGSADITFDDSGDWYVSGIVVPSHKFERAAGRYTMRGVVLDKEDPIFAMIRDAIERENREVIEERIAEEMGTWGGEYDPNERLCA